MTHGIVSGSTISLSGAAATITSGSWISVQALNIPVHHANIQQPVEKPVDKPEPPRSRIKMIAVGPRSVIFTNSQTLEIDEGIVSVPYVLTHDDRVFQYNHEEESWDELPPIPDL